MEKQEPRVWEGGVSTGTTQIHLAVLGSGENHKVKSTPSNSTSPLDHHP